ncbi:hypothetical protein ACQEU5_24925 [Marinactinospora thermotolerans]|uniref:hypothetical protein n=1 Tax=Marinactinospora thermotolerans TaxID=531310 RepID=UPI003D92C732
MTDPSQPTNEGWGEGVVVLGAHGGAGATTLTHWLPSPSFDLGPVVGPDGAVRQVTSHGRPIILTTRNTVHSAQAASIALNGLRDQGLRVACLVIVDDGAGSTPREAKVRFRMLEGHVGGTERLSFLPTLRGSEEIPPEEELPRKMVSELTRIKELVQKDGTP